MTHAVFTAGGRTYDLDQVIRAADFRTELTPFWRNWRANVAWAQAAERYEPDETVLQARMAEFRYRHYLTAAEECEDWLAERGLTADDMRQHFVRGLRAEHGMGHNGEGSSGQRAHLASTSAAQSCLTGAPTCSRLGTSVGTNGTSGFPSAQSRLEVGAPLVAPSPASEKWLRWFWIDLLLADEFEVLARRLAWRVAARLEAGEPLGARGSSAAVPPAWNRAGAGDRVLSADPAWEAELAELEAAFAPCCRTALTPEARKRMHASLRMSLVRPELEVLELDTEAAAREAFLCAGQDGQSLAQVAEAGGYPLRTLSAFVEDLREDWRQPVLSAYPGTVLRPFQRDKGYELCRVIAKPEPPLDNAEVGKRVDEALLRQHLSELEARHVQWQIALEVAE